MKKQPITLESLAAMVQRGFSTLHDEIAGVRTELHDEVTGLRKDMATKHDLHALREEMRQGFDDVKSSVKSLRGEVGVVEADLGALEKRVARLERHADFTK